MCSPLRDMLRRCAEKHGADLVCRKKSFLFAQWLSKTKQPYVLFTDWREVKGCLQAISHQGSTNRPIFTSVFGIHAKQQCRAERWVTTFAERKDPIYINGSLPFAESTVPSLLLQASKVVRNDVQVPSMSSPNRLINGDVPMSCNFEVVHPTTHEQVPRRCEEIQPMKDEVQLTQGLYHTLSRRTDVPTMPCFELSRPRNGMQAQHVSPWAQLTMRDVPVPLAFQQTQLKDDQVQALPLCVTTPTKNTLAAVLHATSEVTDLQSKVNAQVAWIWESLASPAEVEKALLAAMPESYEE